MPSRRHPTVWAGPTGGTGERIPSVQKLNACSTPRNKGAGEGVLGLRVYADRNYWIAAGWKDHVVSNPHESAHRGEGRGVGDPLWRGQEARATAGGAGGALPPQEDYLCDRKLCGLGRDAEGAHA